MEYVHLMTRGLFFQKRSSVQNIWSKGKTLNLNQLYINLVLPPIHAEGFEYLRTLLIRLDKTFTHTEKYTRIES